MANLTYAAIFVAHSHQLVHIIGVIDHEHRQILNVDPDVRALFDLESDALVFAQQIPNFFVVNFKVGNSD